MTDLSNNYYTTLQTKKPSTKFFKFKFLFFDSRFNRLQFPLFPESDSWSVWGWSVNTEDGSPGSWNALLDEVCGTEWHPQEHCVKKCIDERRKRIERKREAVVKDRKDNKWEAHCQPFCLLPNALYTEWRTLKENTEQWNGCLHYNGVCNRTEGKLHKELALCV